MEKQSILIAEDNTDTRLVLRRILESNGFEVAEAENGAVALWSLARVQPDLLLTDIMMPGVDGIELIRCVREETEYTELPIVAMTAFGADYLAKAYLTGATATICKPLDVGNLVETIQQLLPPRARTWH
jgi:CheY-like chemotaxis protein